MKTKNILSIFALFFTLSAFSFAGEPLPSKEININEKYNRIFVGENIKLVLLAKGMPNTVIITGSENSIDKISVKVNKSELIISSSGNIKQGNIVVYLSPADLSLINIKSGGSVTGTDLIFTRLTVYINADSRVNLQMQGQVIVKESADCTFIKEK